MNTNRQSSILRRNRRSRRRGSIILEAALAMPILLMIVFASVEFGYALFVKHSLQNAAREGAREGVVPTATNASITQACDNAMAAAGLDNINYSIAIEDKSSSSANVAGIDPGDPVVVQVTASWSQFSVFTSGFGSWVKGDISGRSTMRREG